MATITTETRAEFAAKSKEIKDKIAKITEKEKTMLQTMRSDQAGKEYKKLLLCEDMIYIVTLYIAVNNLSVAILDTKNNDALNDGRKALYKAIIYLEEVVSNTVDCPYADLDDKLKTIENTPVEKRYYIVRKMGLAIQLLADAFGDNSKWKLSFVEIRGRYAVVAKNMIDMKKAAKVYYDPRDPDYENTVSYIRLIRQLLEKSAMEYRDKYETSSRSSEDIRTAINYLIALRRVAIVLGDKDQSEEIRKKALVWKTKMEADEKAGSSK